jgi:hypothetical protein
MFEVSRGGFDASQPVGFCICSGSVDSPLTDEHIAPAGLQGDYVLKAASCKSCACLTSYSELKTLRGPLWAVREQFELFGDRKPTDRPTELPLEILRKDWTRETIMIATDQFPLVFRLPRFPAPRFLTPASPNDADYFTKYDWRQADNALGRARIAKILQDDPGRERPLLEMAEFELSKVLAKIGYGFAIYFLGPYAVRPFVTNIIIAPKGHAPSFLHFVGGAYYSGHPIEELTLTDHGRCVIRTEPHDGMNVVLARIQVLGPPFRSPIYEVVVGELMAEGKIHVPVPEEPQKTYQDLKIASGRIVAAAKQAGMQS